MAETLPHGPRGVAYLRISRDAQDLTSQRSAVQRWLDLKGLTVREWVEDTGSRDLADRRPGFQKLLRAIDEERLDWIVVAEADRVGYSDAYELGAFVVRCRQHGVQLWSVQEGLFAGNDALGQVMAAIGSVRSRDEQVARAQRAIRAKVQQAVDGTYPGGHPPYGMAVVCLDKDSREVWRLEWESTWKRVQIHPDGRRVRFDGKGVFPGRDPGQVLRLAPSLDQKRVEAIRLIYRLWTTTATSLRAIATTLNGLGIKPMNQEGFYSVMIKSILQNEAYVTGTTCYNKRASGRFREFVNGEVREVERVKGRAPVGRIRPTSDHVRSDTPGEGIIDRETFDLAQVKLVRKASAKAPRTTSAFLSGLAYCGHCQKRMTAWAQSAVSYCCSTYRKIGRSNLAGCRLHRVQHHRLASIVDQWLEESNIKLDLLLDESSGLLDALRYSKDSKVRDLLRTRAGMEAFLRSRGVETHLEVDGVVYEVADVKGEYRKEFDLAREDTLAKIAQLEADLEQMVDSFVHLKSAKARDLANQKLEAVEAEIDALRQSLVPLDERADGLLLELRGARERIREAREALAGESGRRRAEALSRVLARVVLFFRYQMFGTQERSILTEVRFEPLVGEAQDFPVEGSPGPGFVGKVLSSTLSLAAG